MSDLHIDEFYQDVARTLVSLFDVFPRPVTIYAEDIAGPDEPDEYGVHSRRYQACFATLMWLAEEGYLRYTETIKQDALDQVVLSARCFAELLKPAVDLDDTSLPQSEQRRRSSLLYQLRDAGAQGETMRTSELVQVLITAMASD